MHEDPDARYEVRRSRTAGSVRFSFSLGMMWAAWDAATACAARPCSNGQWHDRGLCLGGAAAMRRSRPPSRRARAVRCYRAQSAGPLSYGEPRLTRRHLPRSASCQPSQGGRRTSDGYSNVLASSVACPRIPITNRPQAKSPGAFSCAYASIRGLETRSEKARTAHQVASLIRLTPPCRPDVAPAAIGAIGRSSPSAPASPASRAGRCRARPAAGPLPSRPAGPAQPPPPTGPGRP